MNQKINSNFRYATYHRLLLNIPARTLAKHNRRLDDFLQDVDPFNIVQYTDEFCSDDRENCPGLNQLLCDAKHGRFNAVALPCTQMFGASFSHFKSLCEILQKHNVVVIATSRLSTLKRLPASWLASWPLTPAVEHGIHERLQGVVCIFGEFQTLRAARLPCS
jgi:hypothetical protein